MRFRVETPRIHGDSSKLPDSGHKQRDGSLQADFQGESEFDVLSPYVRLVRLCAGEVFTKNYLAAPERLRIFVVATRARVSRHSPGVWKTPYCFCLFCNVWSPPRCGPLAL